MRLLLVEDDAMLGRGVLAGLKKQGYSVDWMSAGQSALQCLDEEEYDLVVLDLGLPDMDGTDVLKLMRKAGCTTPVIILTARDSIADRVGGLDHGADDYLAKPFDSDELMARIRALLRRRSGRADRTILYRDIVLYPDAMRVTYHGADVTLPRREYMLLQELLTNTGRVLTRDQLEQAVYDMGQDVASNAIEVHVHHLRKKFSNDLIRTIRGVGYLVEKA
ncbi:MAG: DNA-binding response regulator [Pseudomonadales bacterium]|jgi:two-component system, OmpR family, response regulator QseB|nr:DNA-binding response regulator [Pseudomonadales bacterium]MCK5789709.1 response regulator transcription factor [Ketobacter sp.]MEC8811433.1 response regulator transcription factor [Pseudomonadota bacterium]HAG93180.1 DNA-binding response regulator [Gammaproteobacteria bacterium]MAQ23860.1 DNA-binding response regulator [Pseudomonadales bacterium]|tara:strand:- start:3043 stop:3702 length:660 start_codon:yes stop_codon:yes gene_type:complete